MKFQRYQAKLLSSPGHSPLTPVKCILWMLCMESVIHAQAPQNSCGYRHESYAKSISRFISKGCGLDPNPKLNVHKVKVRCAIRWSSSYLLQRHTWVSILIWTCLQLWMSPQFKNGMRLVVLYLACLYTAQIWKYPSSVYWKREWGVGVHVCTCMYMHAWRCANVFSVGCYNLDLSLTRNPLLTK